MISRVSAILNTVTDFYKDINPSTLSGAIDIIVVEHADGELVCSPFHVRFGKLQLLRAYEKVVEVTINEEVVDLQMKVGEAGEAFFVLESDTPVPTELATSPMPQPMDGPSGDELEPLDLNDSATAKAKATATHAAAAVVAPVAAAASTAIAAAATVATSAVKETAPVSPDAMPSPSPLVATDAGLGIVPNAQDENHQVCGMEASISPEIVADFQETTKQVAGNSQSVSLDEFLEPMSEMSAEEATLAPPESDTTAAQTVIHAHPLARPNDCVRIVIGTEPTLASPAPHAVIVDMPDAEHRSLQHVEEAISQRIPDIAQESIAAIDDLADEGRGRQPAAGNVRRRSLSADTRRLSKDHPLSGQEAELRIVPDAQRKSPGPLSDNESEHGDASQGKASSGRWSWGWGSLPSKGLTLHRSSAAKVGAALNTASAGSSSGDEGVSSSAADGAVLSPDADDNGTIDLNAPELVVEMSLCGYSKDRTLSEESFHKNRITFEEFSQHPHHFMTSPDLVLRINNAYYPWSVASAILASMFVYRQPLPRQVVHRMLFPQAADGKRDDKRKYSFREGWRTWFGRGGAGAGAGDVSPVKKDAGASLSAPGGPVMPPLVSSPGVAEAPGTDSDKTLSPTKRAFSEHVPSPEQSPTVEARPRVERSMSESDVLHKPKQQRKSYLKTLRLTSEQLKKLNLKKGANTATFTVSSKLQGRATCSARIFFWDESVNIVISDIDGTITKSDALGHLFTMVGRDWTHLGVAGLYTMISNNGYQFLYLTSRAIGQAQYTRNYLNKVEQNKFQLPDGPVFLSPDRLVAAFTREVIQRRPEEFKVACLKDVRSLFKERNPFHAGFGNRHTDAFSYRAVGIPTSRIFTINPVGELKLELLEGYKSSYVLLQDMVDHIFPPITGHIDPEYNDYEYWRVALPDVAENEIDAVIAENEARLRLEAEQEQQPGYFDDQADEEYDDEDEEEEEDERVVDFAAYPYI
ncbi:lipin Ned1 [Sorochytrium milnesiophthora]